MRRKGGRPTRREKGPPFHVMTRVTRAVCPRTGVSFRFPAAGELIRRHPAFSLRTASRRKLPPVKMADRQRGKARSRRGGRGRKGRAWAWPPPLLGFRAVRLTDAANRVPPSSPGGGSPLAAPPSDRSLLEGYHLSFEDLPGVGPLTSGPSEMEGAQESPARPGSSVPWSEEPAGSARVPEVALSEESEGCARPLEAAPQRLC